MWRQMAWKGSGCGLKQEAWRKLPVTPRRHNSSFKAEDSFLLKGKDKTNERVKERALDFHKEILTTTPF